jgi:hypothetical protein
MSYAHMPICQYVIVIELDKRHVIVFLSIFHIVTMPRTKSGLLTSLTYTLCVFLLNVKRVFLYLAYALSYVVYLVYRVSMTYTHIHIYTYDIHLSALIRAARPARLVRRDPTGLLHAPILCAKLHRRDPTSLPEGFREIPTVPTILSRGMA